MEVEVLVGPTGCGKTSSIINDDNCEEVFIVDTSNERFPFDGYEGEKTILFDDFYGQIPYEQMLRYLDRYKVKLNIKNGHTYAAWNKVYITSNKEVCEWYNCNMDAFNRRISKLLSFNQRGFRLDRNS